ncbi:unnamed protein product, partial [Polarella glacialis]
VQFRVEIDPWTGKGRAREAVILTRDVAEQTPIGQAQEVEPSSHHAYDRMSLLMARHAMLSVVPKRGRCGPRTASNDAPVLGIRTVLMPASVFSPQLMAVQDPELDDENLCVRMEARLSKESGADSNNWDTFGDDCWGGWSFEEALAANSRLPMHNETFEKGPARLSVAALAALAESLSLSTDKKKEQEDVGASGFACAVSCAAFALDDAAGVPAESEPLATRKRLSSDQEPSTAASSTPTSGTSFQ